MIKAWVRCTKCNYQEFTEGSAVQLKSSKCPKCGNDKVQMQINGDKPDWFKDQEGSSHE